MSLWLKSLSLTWAQSVGPRPAGGVAKSAPVWTSSDGGPQGDPGPFGTELLLVPLKIKSLAHRWCPDNNASSTG